MEPTGDSAPARFENGGSGLNRYLVLSLYLPAIAAGLGTGITTPVLPVLAKSFDVTVGVASLVFIVHMLGATIGTIPTGYLLDRIGRRRVLLTGPILAAAASFLITQADSFPELLVYRFIGGWGQQMWMLSRITVIADTGGTYQRGRQITSMFGAQRVGMLLGPAIGGFAATYWGLHVPFVMHGAVMLIAVVPSFFLIRETVPVREATAAGAAADQPSSKLSWRTFLTYPIPAVLGAQFLVNIARGGIEGGGILVLYGVYAYGAGPATLGVLSSVVAGVGIPITLMAGVVMDRWGRKFTIVPGTVTLGAGMLFMAATSFASLPFAAFVGAFVLLHVAASLLAGSMQTLVTDIAPTHARGMFFGISRLVAQSGRLSSPVSFAALAELASFTAAFAFLGAASIASGLVVVFLVRETLGTGARADPRPQPGREGQNR